MSNIYLVRHGQAGTRDAYDSLSELGRRQARLLGEYFVSQGIEFRAGYVGAMSRQQQTAAQVRAAYEAAGASFPEVTVESGWDEFDLHQVYRELAPRLCEEDAEFRRDYEEMRAEVAASAGAEDAEVHRRWRPCDTKVVEAWFAGRYAYTGETWEQFRGRVAACRLQLGEVERDANVAVFTSATPTAIWAGLALGGIPDERVRQIAGVLRNSSFTVLHLRGDELRLFSFNETPHLTLPELRTHR
ncbi:MAG TPA: histidine phosphatase family protein [Pyrinomonadaceae bacterium]|nr:histidine phosphatase family protein [Pyrinomonadaceae bacterium]